jgi:transcriptional regulator with XRE-family HTH domain
MQAAYAVCYAVRMNGEQIRGLRESLGMTIAQFAQLMGVHATTAYRWEMAKGAAVLDPLHASLLLRLQQSLASRTTKAARKQWATALVTGVLLGGTLAGLAVLLAELLPAGQPPSPPKRRR